MRIFRKTAEFCDFRFFLRENMVVGRSRINHVIIKLFFCENFVSAFFYLIQEFKSFDLGDMGLIKIIALILHVCILD